MEKKSDDKVYVVYDQYHWLLPDHIEIPCNGWEYAREVYQFVVVAHPGESIGLTDLDNYNKMNGERAR